MLNLWFNQTSFEVYKMLSDFTIVGFIDTDKNKLVIELMILKFMITTKQKI